MSNLLVKIGKEELKIEKEIFCALLNFPSIKHYKSYEKAISTNEISLFDLKDLARRAYVPYPLFFASQEKVDKQIKDQNKNIFDKLPTKSEMQIGFRGNTEKEDIELIIKDLARKQEFLKKRVLTIEKDNIFVGSVSKMMADRLPIEGIAKNIRGYFGIDLNDMRKLPKAGVVEYLCKKIEEKNILISMSSHDYMPQNLNKELELSGMCVKDKKFPYIFINTRDGDDKPLILETDGRKIFTILSMLVCIGMNKFILNTKSGKQKDRSLRIVFAIDGEILIPANDLNGVIVRNIDDLKKYATSFKVTPSMLLLRLRDLRLIERTKANEYKSILSDELKSSNPPIKHQPTQTNGYAKYNGEKLSRQIIRAHNSGKITFDEVKNILFRRGKMDTGLYQEYSRKFN